MIRNYLDEALQRAKYTPLEDGLFAAEVRGLKGVIATGETLERCRELVQPSNFHRDILEEDQLCVDLLIKLLHHATARQHVLELRLPNT